MDNLNVSDLLSNLKSEDIESLKSAASEILGNSSKQSHGGETNESNSLGLDFSAISKLSGLMGGVNSNDKRFELIRAIKPMLSESRRYKADEALKMLQLFEMLPKLREQGML